MNLIVTENNDMQSINWRAGQSDPLEAGNGIAGAIRRANLATLADGKITFAMAKYGGWHELGTVVEDAMTGQEALAMSGLDRLRYEKRKNFVELNDMPTWTGGYSIIRTDSAPNFVIAPHVGERYSIFSPLDMIDVFDVLFAEGLKIETCGAIGHGERIWFQAIMSGHAAINGDEITRYLHGTTTFDASGSTRFFPTVHRPVCANTQRLAMRDCIDGIALRHTKNAVNRKNQIKAALIIASKDFARYVETGNRLATSQIDRPVYFDQMADMVLDKTIAGIKANKGALTNGDISRAIEAINDNEAKHVASLALARFEKARLAMVDELFEISEQPANGFGANDAWHCYNTVSQLADHGDHIKFRGVTGGSLVEAKQLGKLFGRANDIKQNAWRAAQILVGLAV